MKTFIYIFAVMTCFLLAGCSSEKKVTISDSNEVSEETVVQPSREAVFVYGKNFVATKFTLKLGGEPRLLSAGYLRLAGVVGGEKPTACLELGGKGFAAQAGDKIDDYRIVRIESDYVVLEK